MSSEDPFLPDAPLNTLFWLLADEERRALISELNGTEGFKTVLEIAKTLAAKRCGDASDDLPVDEVEEIRIRLHHAHLPKLAAAGIIGFQSDEGLVIPTEDTKRLHNLSDYLIESIQGEDSTQ